MPQQTDAAAVEDGCDRAGSVIGFDRRQLRGSIQFWNVKSSILRNDWRQEKA